MARKSTIGTLLYVLLGPIAWAAHLTVIYSAQATLCALAAAQSPGSAIVALVIAAATAVAIVLVAAGALRSDRLADSLGAGDWPPASQLFHRRVMTVLAILSLFGIVATGATAFWLPACAPLR